jgi:hypothetical protein
MACAVTRISSRMTYFYKRIFPLLWIGFIAVFAGLSLSGGAAGRDLPFIVIPCVMVAVGFVVFRRMIWSLADEVFDAGDALVVRKGGYDERIPLSGIMNVSTALYTNPQLITLRLLRPGRFGAELAFMPATGLRINPFARNKIADDLAERVDRARATRAT